MCNPDGIPSFILKNSASLLGEPLNAMFNIFLELFYLPLVWKKSNIISLFKCDRRMDISNHRGIAKINAILMLLEKALFIQLYHQSSSLLFAYQCRSRKYRLSRTNIW